MNDEDDPNELSGYDAGWRRGMFDKCNGRPRMVASDFADTAFNLGFFAGYDDNYDANERRI